MPKVKLSPTASSIPFDDLGNTYKPGINSVNDALVEVRNTRVSKVDTVTTSATTKVLTIDDTTFHEVTGSTTGFSYKLPAGTSLSNGREYEIFNNSTVPIDIKNGSDAVLFTLVAGDFVRLILVDNTTTAGQWIQIVSSATATGVVSYSVGSGTQFSTNNFSDTLITGMTVTPVSGRYQCLYSADITIISNNKESEIVFFKGSSAVTTTRRTAQGVGSNSKQTHTMISEISVNGSEAISARVNVSGGSVEVNQRRMILIRLGS